MLEHQNAILVATFRLRLRTGSVCAHVGFSEHCSRGNVWIEVDESFGCCGRWAPERHSRGNVSVAVEERVRFHACSILRAPFSCQLLG